MASVADLWCVVVGNLALKKKGLRQATCRQGARQCGWKPCPEEKGIKTRARARRMRIAAVGNLALKKKGLRPVRVRGPMVSAVGNLALKKKGLRPRMAWSSRRSPSWKPCPEEKGIKTNLGCVWTLS